MAKFGRFLDAEVTVNAIDLSSFVRSVTLDVNNEILETTAMGDTTRVKIAGMKDWSASVEFYNSFYTAEVDATLWPLNDNGTVFTLTVMPNKTDGVSEVNPKYSGSCILPNYQPIAGAHNDVLMSTVSFEASGELTKAVV
jgi:predicted secreted protein